MFGWFSKEQREERRRRKVLRGLSNGLATLDRLAGAELLWFDEKQRRLVIERSLAVVMMAQGAEEWTNFLRNCFLWQYDKECRKAWKAYMQREELKAVREAVKKGARAAPARVLSRRDIERVKEARRMEIRMSEVHAPKVEGFEFFVVGSEEAAGKTSGHTAADGAAVTQQHTEPVPGGRLLAVGWYHPDKEWPEMASWEEVSRFLGNAQS